jgi:hypothetical protein
MGALIPLAISIAPEIGKWLFGDKGEQVASAVSTVIGTVTGTTDEAVQQATIERDPTVAANLRLELAKLAAQQEADARKSDQDALSAQLADVANARSQTVALAQSHSAIAWAPAVVSGIVLVTFGIVMYSALTRSLPSGSETILNMLLGTLAAMSTSVVSYWVGSSVGSARKDDRLAQIATSKN